MSVRNLDLFFEPRRIALVGVTINPNSVGGKVLGNLVAAGYRGVVYPVNPSSEAVMGVQCYPDVRGLPKVPDLAILCSPARQVPGLVSDCGEAGIRGLIVMSAGFGEVGEEGRALEQKLRAEVSRFDGMRLLGPNCLGVIVPGLGLNASFAAGMPGAGKVAFISQSGALCTSVLDWARDKRIGFSKFVSIGNAVDIGFSDLIDYLGDDEATDSILLYIESIRDAREFMTAARAVALRKPIVAYKAGRFPESARAAASHTGALASADSVYDAAFRRAGIARVLDIGEIFDVAELIGRERTPRGPRLGIVTNAGGPGVMAADALISMNGTLARLSEASMAALNESLPPVWSHSNPVDVIGDARAKRYEKASRILLEDQGVDALLVILTPQGMTDPSSVARAIGRTAGETRKPVLAAWMGGESVAEGIGILVDSGVATYTTPEQGVRAFMTLVDYSRNLQALYETPREIPVEFELDRPAFREKLREAFDSGESVLTETVSKMLLEAYGIDVAMPRPAQGAEEAVSVAVETGFPVVMKVLSPDLSHKTDAGGVILGLRDADAVRDSFHAMMGSVRERAPEARIEGVTIQPMIDASGGVELILGIKRDPVFGSVIMVGMGGTWAEVMADTALGFPPLSERLARRMLESLRVWPLLKGPYRGRPAIHLDGLLETMIRLSYMAADYPEIVELDVNPLLATPNGSIALDARVVVDPLEAGRMTRPYAHLALRPYPEEYVRSGRLKDGTGILLRPIKPEDEPLWMEMLSACSRESIYSRFRYFFRWSTHEAAIRYCFNDYDREIAIVAEMEQEGRRRLIGVGRLVADPDHESGEYAVLIADRWQNAGLGGILTDYCIEIARRWGLRRIIAQTTTDNARMIDVLEKRGFSIERDLSTTIVDVLKVLDD
ncbi:bifunctional acetate--CoA ligase family protein/GNAT family N-acetyltransferase [Candidatus Fermentibacterales bacterium]|nr:bifunctional acetate--CoA ligase family protein/GNAT family N-acetyltransferase [Candidatus Fermentibacterales bacterium]